MSAESLGVDFAFPDDFLQGFLPANDLQSLDCYPDLDLNEFLLADLPYVDLDSGSQELSMLRSPLDASLTRLRAS